MSNPETVLQQEIRLALGRYPDLTLWRNSTGAASPINPRDLHKLAALIKSGSVSGALSCLGDMLKRPMIKYGLCVGSADLIGILAPHGRLVALEVKTETGRPSTEQSQFIALVQRRGGFGCIVRSVPEAIEAIDRARAGASE
jgi:hypothetical protein